LEQRRKKDGAVKTCRESLPEGVGRQAHALAGLIILQGQRP